jgi:hypothetical protein
MEVLLSELFLIQIQYTQYMRLLQYKNVKDIYETAKDLLLRLMVVEHIY